MSKVSQKELVQEIEELTRDNEKLRAENDHLQDELVHQPRSNVWRGMGIGLCIVLAALFLAVGNVLFWAGNTLVNTDRYIQTVKPVLEDSAVQAAVADYTSSQLFKQVDVTGYIQNALPPKASFLAPALTTQLRNATDKTLQSALGSDRFQTVWINTNRTAHDKLISSIKHSDGDGVVSLQDVYDTLGQNLQGTKLAFLAGKPLPKNVGSITVINAPWIPKARFIINGVGWLKPLTLLFVAVFTAAAVWLSRRRRTIIAALAVVGGLGMALTLVGIHIVKHAFVVKAPAAYQVAAGHAADIIMHQLAVQTLAILCILAAVAIITWLTGPYKYARAVRRLTAKWLTTPIHRFLWPKENDVTKWVADRRTALEWAAVAVATLDIALTEISPKVILTRTAGILVATLLVETIAAPRIPRKT